MDYTSRKLSLREPTILVTQLNGRKGYHTQAEIDARREKVTNYFLNRDANIEANSNQGGLINLLQKLGKAFKPNLK